MTASVRLYRRYLLALCGCLLVFFGARWVFQQDKQVRLREIPAYGAELFDIQNGIAYLSLKEARGPRLVSRTYPSGQSFPQLLPTLEPLVLQSMPVQGGPTSLIGEHHLQNTIFRRVQLTGDAIYYIAYPENQNRLLTLNVAVPGTQQKTQVSYLTARASLYSLPRSGGKPAQPLPGREFAVNPVPYDGEPLCVLGEKIYWIEIDAARRPRNRSASLKVVTKDGDEAKTLLTGLSPLSSLVLDSGEEGVFWIFAPPEDEISKSRKLYRVTSVEEKPRLFLWSRETEVRLSRAVTLNGRVYWKRDFSSPPETDHEADILSAAPDGSDTRVEYAFSTSASIPSQLYQHAGALYFEVYKGREAQGRRAANTLMRLAPGASPAVREVFRFPAMVSRFFLDGSFLYYMQEEERGQTTPTGSQGSFPVFARVLRRCPLPP